MVAELEAGRFYRVRPLWVGMGVQLAVESILAGGTAARMFVDDAAVPRAALTWAGHRVYLVGDVGGAGFGEALRGYASTHGQFVAYCGPEAFDGAEKLLSGYRVRERGRLYYEGDPSGRACVVEPPEGYVVERITGELLGRGLGHTDWVRGEMCSERESVEEFLGKGFGFAAVHGGSFACWCMSEYNLGDRCEVGIETVAEHRRRGLAVLVAGAMFRHAAGVGVRRVGWHCWADNAGSVATAERLGLRRVAEYAVLTVDARRG
ncbi:MAG: GNAT family N-acetyltransferase [Candidatus Bathyarchaeota archaeon]|nr:GNAT family N-acetyltransferase [Candidatus Bathyarchaeota archaeon]